ncbi:hypothetical protein BKA70DRAFT_1369248 [Coprinopsis sp. MPI-PUGE-AT-0042]|nr:hypothetical protein BKA70DRAFT_1369248 [Coprinopsis sp. MPI-PUGE-AT-0042]
MATAILPAYDLPPQYSSSPQPDETTVAHNRRQGLRNTDGRFTRRWGDITLVLKEQDNDARFPVYSRGGHVDGEIGFSGQTELVEVTVKLYGQMCLMATDCGSTTSVLVSDCRTLWTKDGNKKCPSILPFSLRFPQTFKDEKGKGWKLPPSFDSEFNGGPAMRAKCMYALTISVTRMKRYALASWMSSRMHSTTLDYRPRTRPPRPIVMLESIFDSIKPVPEEWRQYILKMEPRSGSNTKPIECHFLLPSVQSYSVSDTVPFHIQLRGPLASLSEIVPPQSPLLDPNTAEATTSAGLDLGSDGPHPVRVYIARQVHIQVKGITRSRTYTVGTAKIWPIPPVIMHEEEDLQGESEEELCLDWQGKLKCCDDAVKASFSAGNLTVKDYVVLSLSPSNSRPSFLAPVQLTQPIRLVTDSWMDLDSHPQDM